MPLGNYVILTENVPEHMHFASYVIETRDVTDPSTLKIVPKKVALFTCDRVNGVQQTATLSVMAEKLFRQIEPYLINDTYKNYEWIITKSGQRFATEFIVERIPLTK